ncbi:hypothetical protein EG830_01360 [bacterium]|nr:hypothetical protein [bacterium]
MMIASSDGRKYIDVCRNIYNFAPMIVTPGDLERIHGLEERNKFDDYKRGIGFCYQLLKNSII